MNPLDYFLTGTVKYLAKRIIKAHRRKRKMKKDSNEETGLGNISDFSILNETYSEVDKTEDDFSDFEDEFYLHGYKGINKKNESWRSSDNISKKPDASHRNFTARIEKKSLEHIIRSINI